MNNTIIITIRLLIKEMFYKYAGSSLSMPLRIDNSSLYNPSKANGFTLIEVLVTVAIAAILVSIAIPSMKEGILNGKTKAFSSEFTSALHLAQSEAVKRGIRVSIKPVQTTGNQWQTGWNIFVDTNENGINDNGEELIQTFSIPSDGLTLTSKDSVFSNWVAFLPSGATKGNAGISGGFRLCRADSSILKSRDFTLQSSGNIIVEKGTLSCP